MLWSEATTVAMNLHLDFQHKLVSLKILRASYHMSSDESDLAFIRFIEFDKFKALREYPRYPDQKDITTPLAAINRDDALMIFISHCWLRGNPASVDWTGTPHPDNVSNDKFKLSVKGVEWVKEKYAPDMKECFVWLDYGCVNQNSSQQFDNDDLSSVIKRYDVVVEHCDLILTPITGAFRTVKCHSDIFGEYLASVCEAWNGGPSSYLHRAWCRMEMLYGANIPVRGNSDGVERHTLFQDPLSHHFKLKRRPHFLCTDEILSGTKEPLLLPPLQQGTYASDYDPLLGNLSVPSDMVKIRELLALLQPYIDIVRIKVGYVGTRNLRGEKHGFGTQVYHSGNSFTGCWVRGKKHGRGVFKYHHDGRQESGTWRNGRKFVGW